MYAVNETLHGHNKQQAAVRPSFIQIPLLSPRRNTTTSPSRTDLLERPPSIAGGTHLPLLPCRLAPLLFLVCVSAPHESRIEKASCNFPTLARLAKPGVRKYIRAEISGVRGSDCWAKNNKMAGDPWKRVQLVHTKTHRTRLRAASACRASPQIRSLPILPPVSCELPGFR